MLLRNRPFKEWVTVYYDPERITEKKLGLLMRARRCPGASLDRPEGGDFSPMNPVAGPGDIVQLRLAKTNEDSVGKIEIPKGWERIGEAQGFKTEEGTRFYSFRVPTQATKGTHEFTIDLGGDRVFKTQVEVVRKIGK